MNKYYIDAVIVVEGKSDVSYLSSFIDSQFFITNGYEFNFQKLDFLKRVSEVNKVIVFTDNDKAGETIENKLKSNINSVFVVKSEKITRKSCKKSGVAETDKQEILRVLKPFISNAEQKGQKRTYNLTNIVSLSSNPKETREIIINEYRLIDGNNKYLEQQLNMLKVDEQEFKQKYGN